MRCACVANGALRGAGRTTRSAHTRQPTVLDIGHLIGGVIQEQAGLCQTRGWTGRTRTAAMSAHDKGFSIVTWSLQALLPDFTLNASSRESLRSPLWCSILGSLKSEFNEFPGGLREANMKSLKPGPRKLAQSSAGRDITVSAFSVHCFEECYFFRVLSISGGRQACLRRAKKAQATRARQIAAGGEQRMPARSAWHSRQSLRLRVLVPHPEVQHSAHSVCRRRRWLHCWPTCRGRLVVMAGR